MSSPSNNVLADYYTAILGGFYSGGDTRETQEMVFEAHERAFGFFKGGCTRGIYDNSSRALRVDMKIAVDTIFVGKDRQYNRRFLKMCSHHLVDPVACTPASGWG